MKKLFKRYVSVFLALTMMVTAMPVSAMTQPSVNTMEAQESNEALEGSVPESINNAVAKFIEAISKFSQNTSEMSELSSYLTRFGGITSFASGVIGVLTMVGTIKDPTKVALTKIIDEVHNIQDQLKQMDVKLDGIQKDIEAIAVKQEEIDRNTKARDMLNYWRNFNKGYCEPLDRMIETYKTKIDNGIADWWGEKSHDGIRVAYTIIKDEPSLTYLEEEYSDGLPETAANGERVSKDYSFGVPAEYIPDQQALGKWKPDTYRQKFESKMAVNLVAAANDHKLDANEAFYTAWDGLNQDQKEEKAKIYAMDILNTQIYHIACQEMSTKENNEWVTEVRTSYSDYCSNVMIQNSGINAMLNAMYNTHAFEGEIKKDIEDLCDYMIIKTGFYGQFALTCVCQDERQSKANRQDVQQQFADTINGLADKKKQAITGYDNFCYITGTKLVKDTVTANTSTHIQEHNDDYEGCTADPWSISLPPILNNVYTEVLYHHYQTQSPSKVSFANYLHGFGVFKEKDFKGYVMTNYIGAVPFGLNEGLLLQRCPIRGCNGVYFAGKEKWSINVGNDSDVENQYFQVHDKLMFDAFDMTNEVPLKNLIGGARAFYGETHTLWIVDVMCHFHLESTNPQVRHQELRSGKRPDGTEMFNENLTTTFSVLKLEPVKKDTLTSVPNSRFLNSNVYNKMLEEAQQDPKTTITDISLSKSSFVYTGYAIKPSVTVKAGSSIVPATGYEVTYSSNKDVGTGIVTVTGTGNYAGVVSKVFTILPKGTSINKVKRTKVKTTASVTWKKQSTKMASSRITGYQIRYSTKSSMKGAKTVKVKGYSKTTKTIKGLKNKKKYYFQIRTYMELKKNTLYSSWSKKKALK